MLVGVGVARRLSARAAPAASAPALAALRPDQLTVFGALSPRQALALFLPTLCLLLGEANMYQKFFSARDERAARGSRSSAGSSARSCVETLIVVGRRASAASRCRASSVARVRRRSSCAWRSTCCRPLLGVLLLARRRRDHRVDRQQLAAHARRPTWSRDVYQRFVNPAADRSPDRALHARRSIVALGARRARRRQLLPDDSRDGAVGLHDVRRRHHAGAARRAGLAARRAPGRRRVDRRGMAVTLLWEIAGPSTAVAPLGCRRSIRRSQRRSRRSSRASATARELGGQSRTSTENVSLRTPLAVPRSARCGVAGGESGVNKPHPDPSGSYAVISAIPRRPRPGAPPSLRQIRAPW